MSGSFQKTSQSRLCGQVARFYNESALRSTEQKKKTRHGPESFKGTCTLLLSFFLELYTRLFFFHLGGGGKKPTTPYFTTARFVQPRRTLRTRILQRYLYSISFFLSGTLHSSFLLSSRGWWPKKKHYPLFHHSTLCPTEEEVTDQDPSKVYEVYFFLSFFLELYTRLVSFLLSSRGKWTKKNHYPLFHQITLRPTEQDVMPSDQDPSKLYVPFSFFLSLLNLKVFWYLYSIRYWCRCGGIGRSWSCKKLVFLTFSRVKTTPRVIKPQRHKLKNRVAMESGGGGGGELIQRRRGEKQEVKNLGVWITLV